MFEGGSISNTLGLDMSPFAQGMLQATSIASIFPATVTNFLANPLLGVIGIAADVTSALKGAFLEIGNLADNMGESAEKIGVSTDFLSGVGAAFADAGSSAEGLADSMKFLNKNAADAAAGNKEAMASFEKLGISVDFVKRNLGNSEALFFAAADGIKGMTTAAQKNEAAMGLLGRGGTDAIAALNKGSGGLKEFAKDIERLGAVIHKDLADAGDAFGTLSTLTDKAFEGIKIAAAKPVLLALQKHFGEVKEGIFSAADFMRAGVEGAVGGMVDFVESHFGEIKAVLSSVAQVATSLAHAGGSLIGWLRDMTPLLDLAGSLLAGLGRGMSAAVSAIANFGGSFNTWADSVSESMGRMFGGGATQATQWADAVEESFGRVSSAADSMKKAEQEGAALAAAMTDFPFGSHPITPKSDAEPDITLNDDDRAAYRQAVVAATAQKEFELSREELRKQYAKAGTAIEDRQFNFKRLSDAGMKQIEKLKDELERGKITRGQFDYKAGQIIEHDTGKKRQQDVLDRPAKFADFIRAGSADAMRLQFSIGRDSKDEVAKKQLTEAQKQSKSLDDLNRKAKPATPWNFRR